MARNFLFKCCMFTSVILLVIVAVIIFLFFHNNDAMKPEITLVDAVMNEIATETEEQRIPIWNQNPATFELAKHATKVTRYDVPPTSVSIREETSFIAFEVEAKFYGHLGVSTANVSLSLDFEVNLNAEVIFRIADGLEMKGGGPKAEEGELFVAVAVAVKEALSLAYTKPETPQSRKATSETVPETARRRGGSDIPQLNYTNFDHTSTKPKPNLGNIVKEQSDSVSPAAKSKKSNKVEIETEVKRLKNELQSTVQVLSLECLKDTGKVNNAAEKEELQRKSAALEKERTMKAIKEVETAKALLTREFYQRQIAEVNALRSYLEKKKVIDRLLGADHRYRKYTIEEIVAATEVFSPEKVIGDGGYGKVYRCNVDSTPVAVKVVRLDSPEKKKEFLKWPSGLVPSVENRVRQGTLAEMLDKSVSDWPLVETEKLAQIDLKCAKFRCRDRPDLEGEVIPVLKRLLETSNSKIKKVQSNLRAPSHYFCPILQ
ncbi:unnamed protein product [Cochlearia groenlandica]